MYLYLLCYCPHFSLRIEVLSLIPHFSYLALFTFPSQRLKASVASWTFGFVSFFILEVRFTHDTPRSTQLYYYSYTHFSSCASDHSVLYFICLVWVGCRYPWLVVKKSGASLEAGNYLDAFMNVGCTIIVLCFVMGWKKR